MGFKPRVHREPSYFSASRVQRFERDDSFWEIAQDGISIAVRSGPIGALGSLASKRPASVEAAISETAELIHKKEALGFRRVDDERPVRRRVRYVNKESTDPITRWGGAPSGAPGDDWPMCGYCGAGQSFVFQLCATEVPLFGNRALQYFACLASNCEIYEPTAASIATRLHASDLPATATAPPPSAIVLPGRAMELTESPEPPRPSDAEPYEPAHASWFSAAYGDKIHGTQATGNDPRALLCPTCNRWQAFLAQFSRGPMNGYEDWFHTIVTMCPAGHSAAVQGLR